MDTIAKSDIFFFVTTISVVVVAVIVVIALSYVIRIASDIKYIARKAKEETDDIVHDFKSARESLKSKGKMIATILSSLWMLKGRTKAKKKD